MILMIINLLIVPIAANADYLVTNDHHFNVLKEIRFPRVACITVEEFMDLLRSI